MPSHYKVKKGMAGMSTMNGKKKTTPGTMPGGGKAPMFMMGGKTYADMGAMIKAEAGTLVPALADNPTTFAQMEKAVDKKRNEKKSS
tara:strand:- start:9589 stop:9849 length:261 start_codon:yes stop_codon:yes gene_type:complete